MRGALETCVARPLKDGRESFGRSLIFGPVDADANDVFVRMREDVVEHAIGHRDAELAIDRRNEPRTHRKVTVSRRDAFDESFELRPIRHAVRIMVAWIEEELDMS
jgi:hypothetical protein